MRAAEKTCSLTLWAIFITVAMITEGKEQWSAYLLELAQSLVAVAADYGKFLK